ncbi:cupin domain-containing protein [Actinoplanes sp. NPDC051470]|uniref:JmjC domain-containing protein n=1 Tax=Actinoplanes sp. NPDC051470 TaxID=3157224 RepID=UPI0034265C09
MLLDSDFASRMLTTWPEHPFVRPLPGDSPLGKRISAQTILGFLDAGCAPGDYVNVFYKGAGLHPSRFVIDDRVAPASVGLLLEQGCTFQLREMNRWYPPFSAICAGIQAETGYPGYVSAFVTPAGRQGLEHHWDQYLGIIVQLQGSKTWELFEPKADAPHRDHAMSTVLWRDEWVEQWKDREPDMTVELTAGQTLVLPRGWVHNPHSKDATETSVHVTFVLKERSPFWVAERLISSAINDDRFRAVIPPDDLDLEQLPEVIKDVRALLADYLDEMDIDEMARALRHATEKETSHNTL